MLSQEADEARPKSVFINSPFGTSTLQGHSPSDQRTSHEAYLQNTILGLSLNPLSNTKQDRSAFHCAQKQSMILVFQEGRL